MSPLLISFLGTSDYTETNYELDGQSCSTKFMVEALAKFIKPAQIKLIATDEAWAKHGTAISQTLRQSGHPDPMCIRVPTGGEDAQLWTLFQAIIEAIRASDHPVLFDITHGFRMQPFFAAACIQYIQAVLPEPPSIRVVYGEFRRDQPTSPIWELTPFLDVLSWSQHLMMFLRTGQADGVVAPTDASAKKLGREWYTGGQKGKAPQLQSFAKALKAFGDNFVTIRTGSLLTRTAKQEAATTKLLNEIDQTRDEVAQQLPALAIVLDQVREMVKPLVTNNSRLSTQPGQRCLLALARLYQKMGRYSEAISVLREGWITLGAPDTADNPGPGFSREERKNQERRWQDNTRQNLSVSEIRNDIQHAGFNPNPQDRDWFNKQLKMLLDHWQSAIDAMEPPEADALNETTHNAAKGKAARIWNLTPHPMHYDDGIIQRTIASDGAVRLEQLSEPDEPIDGLVTVQTRYGGATGVPDGVRPGDVLIVSTLVGDLWPPADRPPGVTVLVPDTGPSSRRDDQGRIISVCQFIRR